MNMGKLPTNTISPVMGYFDELKETHTHTHTSWQNARKKRQANQKEGETLTAVVPVAQCRQHD